MRMSLEEIFLQVTTEEAPGGDAAGGPPRSPSKGGAPCVTSSRSRTRSCAPTSPRRSPTSSSASSCCRSACFFYLYLTSFVRQSLQQAQFGGAMNVNQQVIRYVLQNASVIILFIMPMITMRTYSEEKRSGTIELLLTSPVTDVEIILGKFFGALGLYIAMLAVTLLVHGDPVRLRQSRVAADRGRLPRAAADGRRASSRSACFISSTTNNQIVAGIVTFVVFLLLWIIGWFADSAGPTIGADHVVAVDHRALRRLLEGHHRHQARPLLPEPHHVRPLPHGEVGRHRKVARLAMVKRILGLLGWLGVALVFAAVAIRFLKPEWQPYYNGLAIGGLVCTLLYILSQWREIGQAFSGRQARFGTLAAASVLVVLGILVAINYLELAAQQALGPDRGAPVLAVGPDQEGPAGPEGAGQDPRLRAERRVPAVPRSPRRIPVPVEAGLDRIHRSREEARRWRSSYGVTALGTVVFEYKGRNEKVTSDGEQELTNGLIKVDPGPAAEGLLRPGARRERHGRAPTAAATTASSRRAHVRQLRRRQARARAGGQGARRRRRAGRRGTEDRLPRRRRSTRCKAYLAKGGKLLVMLDPRAEGRPAAAHRRCRRCSRNGASTRTTTSSSTSAAWAGCSAPTSRCRSRPATRRTRSRRTST